MHAVGAVLDRQPPVVVDEQSRLITPAQRDGGSDVLFDLLIRQILDAQLDRGDAGLQQTSDPFHAVDDRVKPQFVGRSREGVVISVIACLLLQGAGAVIQLAAAGAELGGHFLHAGQLHFDRLGGLRAAA